MKSYIGCKIIKAIPMSRNEYDEYKHHHEWDRQPDYQLTYKLKFVFIPSK